MIALARIQKQIRHLWREERWWGQKLQDCILSSLVLNARIKEIKLRFLSSKAINKCRARENEIHALEIGFYGGLPKITNKSKWGCFIQKQRSHIQRHTIRQMKPSWSHSLPKASKKLVQDAEDAIVLTFLNTYQAKELAVRKNQTTFSACHQHEIFRIRLEFHSYVAL